MNSNTTIVVVRIGIVTRINMSQLTEDGFVNFFKYYNSEKQQEEGARSLYRSMPDELKDEDSKWIRAYRFKPEKPEKGLILDVPYQSQLDNASGTGYRECFSSSCAMVCMYYGKIENDDAYNKVREKYGDSTDAQAQVRTLRSLGLDANFITNATTDLLKSLLEADQPVPCGWLHHGSLANPSGGGHYSVVCGYNESAWIVNDPNGEADLQNGGYTDNLNGKALEYSYKSWDPRWIVEGEGTGWLMDIKKP